MSAKLHRATYLLHQLGYPSIRSSQCLHSSILSASADTEQLSSLRLLLLASSPAQCAAGSRDGPAWLEAFMTTSDH